MPQQPTVSVQNTFVEGFKTEFTGLNFPENAVYDCQNCVFNRIGSVERRLGINYEPNFTATAISRSAVAVSYFVWENAGGDGSTKLYVLQVGPTLYFYDITAATVLQPLSGHKLTTTVDLTPYVPSGGTAPSFLECQFSSGNGYLFVFHPNLDPIYCAYAGSVVTPNRITIQTRDFSGILEAGVADTSRPPALSTDHLYNLSNQGWGKRWSDTSTTTFVMSVSAGAFTVTSTTLPIVTGDRVYIVSTDGGTVSQANGSVISYVGTTLTINISQIGSGTGVSHSAWRIQVNPNYITAWNTYMGNFPANSDVWWRYKDSTDAFSPTVADGTPSLGGPAPKGHYVLDEFNLDRNAASGTTGLTTVSTTKRPKTGCWYAGRVWYAGVDATGYTEKIYFSQIEESEYQFGRCYQANDPTDENTFDLLPSDGGVVKIQGCGSVYKLFPIQNGILVHAANGIWFINGNQGVGFTANDYSVPKISAIQTVSATSFVNVMGMPMWWNEEGIYTINTQGDNSSYGSPGRGAAPGGGLAVQSITFASIQTFYEGIPTTCKKFARGAYDPLNWEVQWVYKSTSPANLTESYQFDAILTFNVATNSFSPWFLTTDSRAPTINGVAYIQGTGGSTNPAPTFKYLTTAAASNVTFSHQYDTRYFDWHDGFEINYISAFTTANKIKGQAAHKFQSNYINVYSNNTANTSYKIQGIWEFAASGASGRFTTSQVVLVNENIGHFHFIRKRHKIRGRGMVVQYKITSVDGSPFNIIGWSVDERVNQNV